MPGRLCAHGLLAAVQVCLAVAVHGVVVGVPQSRALLGFSAVLLVSLVVARRSDDRLGAKTGRSSLHAVLLAMPLLVGDGVHVTATHNWLQVCLVLAFLAVLASSSRTRSDMPGWLADARSWIVLISLVGRVVVSLPRRTTRTVGSSRRPGCRADRPFLLTTSFRGPPRLVTPLA